MGLFVINNICSILICTYIILILKSERCLFRITNKIRKPICMHTTCFITIIKQKKFLIIDWWFLVETLCVYATYVEVNHNDPQVSILIALIMIFLVFLFVLCSDYYFFSLVYNSILDEDIENVDSEDGDLNERYVDMNDEDVMDDIDERDVNDQQEDD